MTKTAIFVEGQTELIFIREYLLKMFEFQDIWIECYTLFNDNSHTPTEYAFPNEQARHYYQIINVGNDNAVLSRLLRREQYLWNSGFNRIFAIRDMYSRDYREIAQNATIDLEINLRFIDTALQTIRTRAKKPGSIIFQFAIMEAETWILGMKDSFVNLHESLIPTFINEKLNINLDDDPEITYFHPAKTMKDIYQLVGMEYDKSKSVINAIMSGLTSKDFINLCQSGKCQSFKSIHESIIPN